MRRSDDPLAVVEGPSAAAIDALLARVRESPSDEDVEFLHRLVAHPGHRRHQEVLRSVQRLADGRSVPFLRAALAQGFSVYDYTASDDAVIAKWFSWALHDIGDRSARVVVEEFAEHSNQEIAGEMRYRLSRWRDRLTGVLTHVAFSSLVLPEGGQSAIAFDVAGLSWVNDQLGFAEGDATLVSIARLLTSLSSEEGGRVYRYDGDEFLWLLDPVRGGEPRALAQRALDRCVALGLPYRAVDSPRERVHLNAVVLNLRPGDLDAVALRSRVSELCAAGRRAGAISNVVVEATARTP